MLGCTTQRRNYVLFLYCSVFSWTYTIFSTSVSLSCNFNDLQHILCFLFVPNHILTISHMFLDSFFVNIFLQIKYLGELSLAHLCLHAGENWTTGMKWWRTKGSRRHNGIAWFKKQTAPERKIDSS